MGLEKRKPFMISKSALFRLFFLLLLGFGTTLPATAVEIAELVEDLGSSDTQRVELAIEKISDRGAAAASAVPALTDLLTSDNPRIRSHAAYALGQIGKPAMPAVTALARMITDDDPSVRHAALDALAEIEPGPETAVPLLIKSLGDQDPRVIRRALHALADRGAPIVPAMVEAMKDDRTEYWALLVLQEIGPDAKDAVPTILEILHEPNEPFQRMEAALTLGKIGAAAAPAVPALVKLLDDPETGVQHAAVFALGTIGPPAHPAAEKIRSHLDATDPFFWVAGAWALANIYPDNQTIQKTTARFLAEMLTDDDVHVRRAAAQAMLDLKPGPEITLPAMQAALDNQNPQVVEDALIAIAGLGKAAVPGLSKALEYPESRSHVAQLVRHLGSAAAPTVPALIRAYRDEERTDVRRELLFALGHIGPNAKDAVDIAIEGCGDDNQGIRYASFFTLGRIGPEAIRAKRTIKPHLDDEDLYYAATAAWALARIDEDDPDVVNKGVPLFVRGLKSQQAFVRHEAADSLAELGPLAKVALPDLAEAAQDKDPSVAEAAKAAIKKISGR
jgi:HEAT repeat protein